MQIDTLRFLDRYVGIPPCWIFTQVRRLGAFLEKEKTISSPHKVLIIKLSEMGSTVLAYPAVAELKKRCPEAELFFLVFRQKCRHYRNFGSGALRQCHNGRLPFSRPTVAERTPSLTAAPAGAHRHDYRHGFFQPSNGPLKLLDLSRKPGWVSSLYERRIVPGKLAYSSRPLQPNRSYQHCIHGFDQDLV
jgi:hypothetical protein